jgi:hypothetical protein
MKNRWILYPAGSEVIIVQDEEKWIGIKGEGINFTELCYKTGGD